MSNWKEIKTKAIDAVKVNNLSIEYARRLKYEIKEIEKQGANKYWTDKLTENKCIDSNKNGLVLPFLLKLTSVDPIKAGIKHNIQYQTDYPDVDLDFIPHARTTIKEYAIKEYKKERVCSVGSWVTYKPKSALKDVTKALGEEDKTINVLTKNLPDEFDEMTIDSLNEIKKNLSNPDETIRKDAHIDYNRYTTFYEYWEANPVIVDLAFRLVGKIRAQGTHAGGVIISDRPLWNIVPLSKMKTGGWTSQWTEGKSTQLSKFGLVKYDILGLKTLFYVWQACNLIKVNRGVDISLVDINPSANPPMAGYEVKDGIKQVILLNDPKAFSMCNALRTDSVFQIETPIQKDIIRKGKVRNFWDLVVYNALGRPGPMDMIPTYISCRDDKKESWRKDVDPKITEILEETFNVIVYQEQLQAMWIRLANFTVPEAETARKIIAKKWVKLLPEVEKQWKEGSVSVIGKKASDEWWDKMIDFGRYAFNRAHSVAYSLITYWCLYLKSHYPAEWWAAVMTGCHQDKLKGYMSAARLDGVKFGHLDINLLTENYTVKGNEIIIGLKSIKGIGEKATKNFISNSTGKFTNLDQVVAACGRQKNIYERLVHLGAFDKLHSNRRALWMYYLYKYCGDKDLKEAILKKFMPTKKEISDTINENIARYKIAYPNRTKIPISLQKYKLEIGPRYDKPTREQVMALYENYRNEEMIIKEKELLGYYWNSPLAIYNNLGYTIELAKKSGKMDVVIDEITRKKSSKGNFYYILAVTDGVQNINITVWKDYIEHNDYVKTGSGIRIFVKYNENRNNWVVNGKKQIIILTKKGETAKEKLVGKVRDDNDVEIDDPLF
jgi:DNA polymerase-3 subunit alpha